MKFSIRGRLFWSLLLAIVVLGTSASVVTYQRAESDVNELFDNEMKQMTHALGMHISAHPELAQEPLLQEENHLLTQVWGPKGELLASSHGHRGPKQLLAPGFSEVTGSGERWRTYTARAGEYTLQVAQPVAYRQQKAAKIAFNAVVPVAAIVPIGGLIIWLGIGYGLRPLRHITREVQTRDPKSLAPITLGALPSEVAPLVRSLNELMARVDHALELERQFIADASHELRTPVTALGLQLDLLESARTAAEREESIRDVRQGIRRMEHLIEQILTLARLDPDIAANIENIDLARFLEETHSDFLHVAALKSINFRLSIHARPNIRGEVPSLRALVHSLMDNALRYTPEGGEVSIALETAGSKAAIIITDSGPGIPEPLRDQVFERFFRAHADGNDNGTGLGLAIAKRAAERLNVRVQLQDRPHGDGLIALVEFPVHVAA